MLMHYKAPKEIGHIIAWYLTVFLPAALLIGTLPAISTGPHTTK
jgi:hypothetical protein